MSKLIIVPIEPIESRYTSQWYKFLPGFIKENTSFDSIVHLEIDKEVPENTSGGFFNFNFTCEYKAAQFISLSEMVKRGEIQDGDVIFYTDYWNPTVHMTRYILDLNGIRAKIVGFAHAGDWDPADILHQKLVNKHWSWTTEMSLHQAYDQIYFSTYFARQLYANNLGADLVYAAGADLIVTGFPMEYYDEVLPSYWDLESPVNKEDLIVFPHRISDEKNYKLFKILERRLPQYKFVVAMEVCKTKDAYHDLLYRSKVAFSAALQETGGISMGIESLRAGCMTIVPDRLSYAEIFDQWDLKFAGDVADYVVTEDNDPCVDILVDTIVKAFETWNIEVIKKQHDLNYAKYFTGTILYAALDTFNE